MAILNPISETEISEFCKNYEKIWGPIEKTRLLHLGNVEKPPQPQLFAQRAPEVWRRKILRKSAPPNDERKN